MLSDQDKVVLIGCSRSAGEAIASLGALQQALPANVEWVSVPCGSGIDELHLLRAFEAGASRVMVLACYDGACRSVDGARWAAKRVSAARALLEEAGIAGWRLAFHNVAPNMPTDIVHWLTDWRAPAPETDPK